MTEKELLIAEARRYLKVVEVPKGSNRGLEIDYWLTEVGSPLKSAWCAAFVSGVGVQTLGRTRWPFKRSGRVQDIVDDAIAKNKFTQSIQYTEPGDLVVIYYPELGRYGHIAILTKLVQAQGPVLVESIDGNSNVAGSREGYRVLEKKGKDARTLTERFAFLTW